MNIGKTPFKKHENWILRNLVKHVLCKGFSSKFRNLNLLSSLALLFVKNQKYLLQIRDNFM